MFAASKHNRKNAARYGSDADDLRSCRGSKYAARELPKDGRNPKPRQRRYVPGEAQRARGEPGTAEQRGKVVATKQPNENVALSENRVRDAQSED